jgi:hypothetical protein
MNAQKGTIQEAAHFILAFTINLFLGATTTTYRAQAIDSRWHLYYIYISNLMRQDSAAITGTGARIAKVAETITAEVKGFKRRGTKLGP